MTRVLSGLIVAALIIGFTSGVLLFGVVGFVITVPLAVAVAIFIGSPAYILLRKFGWLAWWQLTLAGAFIVLPFAIGLLPNSYFFNAILASGAAAGLAFWLLGIRPNNSFKPNPHQGGA